MNGIKTIYLDMDGVLCDFMTPALLALGYNPAEIMARWPKGQWDLCKVLPYEPGAFQRAIRDQGPLFWSNLPKYSWMWPLLDRSRGIVGFGEVRLLTDSTLTMHSVTGKRRWISNIFGSLFKGYNLTDGEKWRLAKPGCVLIDDNETICQKWEQEGGIAILFPQPWNSSIKNPHELISNLHNEITERILDVHNNRAEVAGMR